MNKKPISKDLLFNQLKAVENQYNADIYLFNEKIVPENTGKMFSEIHTTKIKRSNNKNALLILKSNGGSADNAYQIVCKFQLLYENFFVYAPDNCKSAGTLITLGANKIILGYSSHLGPLDVQLPDRDYLRIRKSGLENKYSLETLSKEVSTQFIRTLHEIIGSCGQFLSTKQSAEMARDLTIGITSPISSQLNPLNIGSDFRKLQIAKEYGERLAKMSGNPKKATIERLINNYPSHGFVINIQEAKELFNFVEEPVPDLIRLIESNEISLIIFGNEFGLLRNYGVCSLSAIIRDNMEQSTSIKGRKSKIIEHNSESTKSKGSANTN